MSLPLEISNDCKLWVLSDDIFVLFIQFISCNFCIRLFNCHYLNKLIVVALSLVVENEEGWENTPIICRLQKKQLLFFMTTFQDFHFQYFFLVALIMYTDKLLFDKFCCILFLALWIFFWLNKTAKIDEPNQYLSNFTTTLLGMKRFWLFVFIYFLFIYCFLFFFGGGWGWGIKTLTKSWKSYVETSMIAK